MKDRVIVFLDEKDPLAEHVALLLNDALEGRNFNVEFFHEDLLQGHKGKRPARYIAIFSKNFWFTRKSMQNLQWHLALWQLVGVKSLVPIYLDGVAWAQDDVGAFADVFPRDMSGLAIEDTEIPAELLDQLIEDLMCRDEAPLITG